MATDDTDELGATDWRAVGERVRKARVAKDLTQRELERSCELSENRLSALERQGARVSEGALGRIAQQVGRSLPYLRYGVETAADVGAVRRGEAARRREIAAQLRALAAELDAPDGNGAHHDFPPTEADLLDGDPPAEAGRHRRKKAG